MDEPTREGARLIDAWQAAVTGLKQATQRVTHDECTLANATNALGRWMVPDDIQIDEPLCVWHRDALISVTKTDAGGLGSFKIEARRSGRKAQLLRVDGGVQR